MSDTILDRYTIGAGKILPVDHTGPASYTTGGETLGTINNMTGISVAGLGSIDQVLGSGTLSVSGNYQIAAQPSGKGVRKTFLLRWLYSPNNAPIGVDGIIIASAGSGQTNGTYTATASAGGAVIQYVISGAALTSVKIINSGTIGFQYTAVPTFTIAAGGTPGTVTAYLGTITGAEVAAATNLSAETVRISYVGR